MQQRLCVGNFKRNDKRLHSSQATSCVTYFPMLLNAEATLIFLMHVSEILESTLPLIKTDIASFLIRSRCPLHHIPLVEVVPKAS